MTKYVKPEDWKVNSNGTYVQFVTYGDLLHATIHPIDSTTPDKANRNAELFYNHKIAIWQVAPGSTIVSADPIPTEQIDLLLIYYTSN